MLKYNPLGVSPKALNSLPIAEKEQVIDKQQRHEPLPLHLQEALDRVEKEASNKQ